jgi:hypothetical protein
MAPHPFRKILSQRCQALKCELPRGHPFHDGRVNSLDPGSLSCILAGSAKDCVSSRNVLSGADFPGSPNLG